ncbi:MAG: hypothetical protein Q4C49_05300 [Bacillota bacterium]|nr:hypothetical protein [Bacillota bacterium]
MLKEEKEKAQQQGLEEGKLAQKELSIQSFAKRYKKRNISLEECLKDLKEDYPDFDKIKMTLIVEKEYH